MSEQRAPSPTDDIPPPMTDEDVNEVRRLLVTIDAKKMNELCDTFQRTIKDLIHTIEKSLNPKDDLDELSELDRARRLINLMPADELFIRVIDKIWHVRQKILTKDAKFFLERDYSKNIKKDQKTVLIETLITVAKYRYQTLTPEEQNIYWNKALKMLECVATFKKLTIGK